MHAYCVSPQEMTANGSQRQCRMIVSPWANLGLVDAEEEGAADDGDQSHPKERPDVARDDQDHLHERRRGGEASQVVHGAGTPTPRPPSEFSLERLADMQTCEFTG